MVVSPARSYAITTVALKRLDDASQHASDTHVNQQILP